PNDVRFVGIDSGIRHSVSGSDYTAVRTGAFIGYRIIADVAGLSATRLTNNTVQIDDPIWQGYLANIKPSEFEQHFSSKLPDEIVGGEFLNRYGGITDSVTRVEPDRTYAVSAPTAHPIFENFRVETFSKMLQQPLAAELCEFLGKLMFQSHASYSK